MKTRLMAALVLVMIVARAYAVEANYCPPAGCPDVLTTPVVQTPQYVTESYPVNVTRMVPVEREVEVPRGRWVTERRQVPSTRTVYVNERYTVNETRYRTRRETRMRQVNRTVRDYETRQVNETVYDEVCDPVTGQTRRVARTVCRDVRVPVRRTVCVDKPYTVKVRYAETVPVTRTRRVARTVPCTREVRERRWVTETVRQKCTSMEPVVETRMETRTRAYCPTPTEPQPVAVNQFASL